MAGITEFLIEHASKDPVSFHMPGHKGKALYQHYGYSEFLESFFDCDVTEIIGADNLFQAEGIIAETMAKYRDLYDADASYLLVNGTSGGIISAILASAGYGLQNEDGCGSNNSHLNGGKLIMARNCHKSVFNALALGGIKPVYAYPSVVKEYGIAGPVEAEEISRLLDENPEAAAVILPSPNYYGICSDIETIAKEVHKRGKILIVDQAHGAHLKFFEGIHQRNDDAKRSEKALCKSRHTMPRSAESCGADIVINSIHKTLASLTQSAVMNVCRAGGTGAKEYSIDPRLLEDKLQAVESTSPSYLLMASLDINADIIKKYGWELFENWQENLEYFYAKAEEISGLKIMQNRSLDFTKINLDMSAYGLDGGQLEKELLKYEIYAELTTGNILMCMTGIGNTRRDFDRLISALTEIAQSREKYTAKRSSARIIHGSDAITSRNESADSSGAFLWTKKRSMGDVPMEKELVRIEDASGRICAASIIPYPPGIPLICPGEEIGSEEIEYLMELRARGEKVMGIDSKAQVLVGHKRDRI